MPQPGLFDALDRWWKTKDVPQIIEGRVEYAKDGVAQVYLTGASNVQPAVYDKRSNPSISKGDRCLMVRTNRTAKWVVITSYGSINEGNVVSGGTGQVDELAPPANFDTQKIGKFALWTWYAPPQKPVAFEVQTSVTATEGDAITQIVTRGSYFLYETESAISARVRSIDSNFKKSGWTPWLSGISATALVGVGLTVKRYDTSFTYTSFNDDGVLTLVTLPAGETILRVRLYIDTIFAQSSTFNAVVTDPNTPTDASLMSGLSGDELAVYEFEPYQFYEGTPTLFLTSSILVGFGTWTAGEGRVVIDTTND